MTAPDPAWVEVGAKAVHARYCACGTPDRIERSKAAAVVAAVAPLIRREALADLRAKVEALRDEAKADPVGSAVWRTTAYGAVLALIEEVDRG